MASAQKCDRLDWCDSVDEVEGDATSSAAMTFLRSPRIRARRRTMASSNRATESCWRELSEAIGTRQHGAGLSGSSN